MIKDIHEASDLEEVKESVLQHQYFKRLQGITQIVPKKITSNEFGATVAPIKKPMQRQIERLSSSLKKGRQNHKKQW